MLGLYKCKVRRITSYFFMFVSVLYIFLVPSEIAASAIAGVGDSGETGETAADDETAQSSNSGLIGNTRIISIIPYVEKTENGAIQSVPVISREDIRANPNSTFLMIKLFINSEDAAKYYGNSLYIFKLKTNADTFDLAEQTPVTSFIVIKESAFEYNVKYLIDLSNLLNGEIFNKLVIATKTDANEYIPISDARYIDDINCLSNKKDTPPESLSKKGLEIQMMGEAKLLGVEHTTVRISLNDFMSAKELPNTEEYTYDGETFYFNIDKISEYDRKIKPLTNDGIKVTAILLLSADSGIFETDIQDAGVSSTGYTENAENTEDTGDAEAINGTSDEISNESEEVTESEEEEPKAPALPPPQYLIHPNALEELESSGAVSNAMFYGINTVTDMGIKYFSALMSFIADRYVKEDIGYGRIYNIILGDEIGNSSIYNNCGQISFEDYVRDYFRAVRICDAAIRSRYGGARVYIPFDNGFAANSPGDGGYVNRDIIDLLCEYSQQEGNFLWNIAYHAYNDDPSDPATWKENAPLNSYETPVITLKNIEILSDYINTEKEEYLPDGERRKIMLSEQGYSSGDGINAEKNMELQAAAFVYGYLKARYLPDISAYIYHRHVDGGNEAESYGLWTRDSNISGTINEPQKKKKIHDVFKYMDTNKEAEYIEFAKDIFGIKSFEELFPLYSALEDRQYAVNIHEATVVSVGKLSNSTISRFNQTNLSGFIATSNVEYLNIVQYSGESERFVSTEKNLLAGFNRTAQGDYSGIFKSYGPGEEWDLSERRYIGLTVRIDTAVKDIETIPLLFILEGEPSPQMEEKSAKNTANTTSAISVINSGIVQASIESSPVFENFSPGIFEGAANIKPNEDTTIYFDLKDFKERGKINKIKLLINPYYDYNAASVSNTPESDAAESGSTNSAETTTGGGEVSPSSEVAKYDFNMYVYNIVSAIPAKLSFGKILLYISISLAVLTVLGYTALVIRARIISNRRRKRRAEQRRRRMQEQRRRQQVPPQ